MTHIRKAIYCIIPIVFFMLILNDPGRYTTACATGISVWANCVLPTVFPFMIFSTLLMQYGSEKISKIITPIAKHCKLPPNASICIALSLISGYPIGCRSLFDLFEHKMIDTDDCTRTSLICSTCGPVFLLGTVGNALFHNTTYGIILLISHWFGVFITAAIFIPFISKNTEHPVLFQRQLQSNILTETIQNSVLSVLYIGGYIAFFSVIICAVENNFVFQKTVTALSHLLNTEQSAIMGFLLGFIEMTKGCTMLAQSNWIFALPCCAFLCTLGGASILIQQFSFLSKMNVKKSIFLAVKFLQSTAAALFCLLFLRFIP